MQNISPSLSPLLIFLAFVLYSVVHSLLASHTVKALVETLFGDSYHRFYRVFFNIVGVVTLLPILAMPAVLPDTPLYTIIAPWRYLTITIQALALVSLGGVILQTGALDFLGLRQMISPPDSNPPKLVTTGFYRWVRHPLYTTGAIFLWFTPVMTLNTAAFYFSLTLYFFIGAIFEERKLEKFFGKEYTAYKARTTMLIPGLSTKS